MFDPQADPERSKMILGAQIIVAALVVGCLFFLLTVLLIVPGKPGGWELRADRPLTLIALAVALGTLAARIIVPGVVAAQMLRQLARQKPEGPDWKALFGVYQATLILKAAILEGAIFLLVIAYMVEHSRWTLALAAAFLLLLLMHMPTPGRVDNWIAGKSPAEREQRWMQ